MAIKGWPFGNDETAQEVTDAEWSKLFSLISSDGVAGMAVSRTSGLGLSVAAGLAVVGGQGVEITGSETVSVGTAHATLNRVDAVVLRRTLTSGSTLGGVTVAVKAGTPTSSPVAPTLTQDADGTWETALCYVTVPAGASALVDANLDDVRPPVGVRAEDIADATELGVTFMTLASASAGRTALGVGAIGGALFQAATIAAARQAIGIYVQQTEPAGVPDGTVWISVS